MTLRRQYIPLFVLVIFFACFTTRAFSQTESASLSGLITDPQGQVVAGVTVEITNQDTGISTQRTTNSAGLYVAVGLKPGRYRVSVSKEGFRRIDLTDLALNVQDVLSRNFHLQLGPVTTSITVVADEATIDTQNGTVSTVVDRQFAENIPLNGRSFQTLIELTPGVVLTPSNPNDSGQFSVNGQRAASNYWTVDGVSANVGVGANGNPGTLGLNPGNGISGSLGSFSVLGGTNSLVSVDAMQEFRIQTSTYAPEFGRQPGGQISIVTRPGTNQWHGTAFDYLRNDILDANNWFNGFCAPGPPCPLPKAEERQNDFGGTFSGPLLKDKMFFFFSYEGLRLRLPQTAISTVPCDSTCQGAGNVRAAADPPMQPFLNALPLPNGPEVFTPCTPNVNGCPASGEQPTGAAQFNASFSNPASLDAYSLRIDRRFGERWSLFARYNYSPSELVQRLPSGLSSLSADRITTQTATVGTTWAISPNIGNDFRFNYSQTRASSSNRLDSFGGAVPLSSLPFPSQFTGGNGHLALTIASLKSGSLVDGTAGKIVQRQINLLDGVSIQKGTHTLKLGVDYRRLSPENNPSLYTQEPIFLNVPNAETGSTFFTIVFVSRGSTLLFRNLGMFAQDTWHAMPRLTLTYGLRWDVDFVPQSLNGPAIPGAVGFNLSDLSQLALAPSGTPPYTTKYNNVAPRLGLAYQLSDNSRWQSVIRGGAGIFYDLSSEQAGNLIGTNVYPFGAENFVLGPIFGGTGTFPLSSTNAAPPVISPPGGGQGQLTAFDPDLKLPYTVEWNVAIEQGLGKDQTLTASYLGATGRRLIQSASIVSPNGNLGEAQLVTNQANSDYNALQLQFQRRLSHGLQTLASYTWSHSIDSASAGSAFGNEANALVPSASANRASSDFDIRHAFSAAITYDLPAPKTNAVGNAILRGWSIQNLILARSAPPVDISDANFFELANGAHTTIRPDLVGQPAILYGAACASALQASGSLFPGQGCPGGKGFNPSAFADPPSDPNTGLPLRQGNVPRNFLRGFGAIQWDFGVHRDFRIRESMKLQIRAEMFNLLNHPNFGPPSGVFAQAGFGVSGQTLGQSLNSGNLGGGAFDPLYQIGGPRSIQFALKLFF